jgi:hypothetical protein
MVHATSSTSGAFYCVCDADHFIGAVALLNSVRLVGHDEPFVIVDCGLARWQRARLERVATLVSPEEELPPMLLKAVGPLAHPADVMVVLDADVIVTRPLYELMDAAATDQIVAFANNNPDRFFPEWGDLFGVGNPRRQTYVASGHLFVSRSLGERFFPLFHETQRRLDVQQTLLGNRGLITTVTPSDPFYYPDMDALNALLSTCMRPHELLAVEYRLAPHAPFDGVELVDARTLTCTYEDGTEPLILHHVLSKPWLVPTRRNPYSLLLPRLLLGDDVELRLEPKDVPRRLRFGALAEVDRVRSDVQAFLRRYLRGRLGIRPRMAAWRASRRAEMPI